MRDRELMIFHSKVLDVAEGLGASWGRGEAEQFVSDLYQAYVNSAPGIDLHEWLCETLKHHFLSLNEPPVWVGDEPAWPFLGGKPMVFISQTRLPDDALTQDNLAGGSMLYLFGGKPAKETGGRMEYRVVVQKFGPGKPREGLAAPMA